MAPGQRTNGSASTCRAAPWGSCSALVSKASTACTETPRQHFTDPRGLRLRLGGTLRICGGITIAFGWLVALEGTGGCGMPGLRQPVCRKAARPVATLWSWAMRSSVSVALAIPRLPVPTGWTQEVQRRNPMHSRWTHPPTLHRRTRRGDTSVRRASADHRILKGVSVYQATSRD